MSKRLIDDWRLKNSQKTLAEVEVREFLLSNRRKIILADARGEKSIRVTDIIDFESRRPIFSIDPIILTAPFIEALTSEGFVLKRLHIFDDELFRNFRRRNRKTPPEILQAMKNEETGPVILAAGDLFGVQPNLRNYLRESDPRQLVILTLCWN